MTSRLIDFQNYGTMVVDSLKRPSRRVEKENIKFKLSLPAPVLEILALKNNENFCCICLIGVITVITKIK